MFNIDNIDNIDSVHPDHHATASEALRQARTHVYTRICQSALIYAHQVIQQRYAQGSALECEIYLALDADLLGRLGPLPQLPRRALAEDLIYAALERMGELELELTLEALEWAA